MVQQDQMKQTNLQAVAEGFLQAGCSEKLNKIQRINCTNEVFSQQTVNVPKRRNFRGNIRKISNIPISGSQKVRQNKLV